MERPSTALPTFEARLAPTRTALSCTKMERMAKRPRCRMNPSNPKLNLCPRDHSLPHNRLLQVKQWFESQAERVPPVAKTVQMAQLFHQLLDGPMRLSFELDEQAKPLLPLLPVLNLRMLPSTQGSRRLSSKPNLCLRQDKSPRQSRSLALQSLVLPLPSPLLNPNL